MGFLEFSVIIDLQASLIIKFGGMSGLRDKKLLESALSYPRLLYSIAWEHDVYALFDEQSLFYFFKKYFTCD